MRRWLIALATALVAGVIWVGAAYADDSIYHGNYNANGNGASTNRCAGCHRAHTGSGPYLIKTATIYGLCTSCHGTTNGLDVVNGVEWQTVGPPTRAADHTVPPFGGNKGGGFVNSLMNTTLTAAGNPALNPAVLKASTSAHKVNGMPNYVPGTAWGIGAVNSGAGATVTLECTSCHDPHGGSGGVNPATGQRIPTYRILRSNVADKVPGAAGPVVVPEDTDSPKEFIVHSSVPLVDGPYPQVLQEPLPAVYGYYYGQSYANTNMQTLSAWCATCHTRIHTAGDSEPATTPFDDIYKFRHVTTGSSVENNLGQTVQGPGGLLPAEPQGYPGCVTCHVGHGTSAASTGRSAQVPKPGTPEGGGNYLDSSLLRLDNHGVCEVCHNK